jgi:NADH-quinone oxidoreductase subunit C
MPGSALPGAAAPQTPYGIAHRGGAANPSVVSLRERFPDLIGRSEVTWGDTTVYVKRDYLADIVRWLHDDVGQRYDMLVDITAVEFRDLSLPMQVVWHLRSLPFRRFLRVKVELAKGDELRVPSVWSIYRGADWLERECYDMFCGQQGIEPVHKRPLICSNPASMQGWLRTCSRSAARRPYCVKNKLGLLIYSS